MASDVKPTALDRKGRAEVAKKAQALERLTVEYVDIDSIVPNGYNPNRQSPDDFQLLLRSIREDGFTQPVVVQRDGNRIVDGEHRWRGARELGMTQIPVVFVDMAEDQMHLSTLRHNRARGSEDVDLTQALFRDLRELGALDQARDALGLEAKDLEKLLDDTPAPEALAGEEFGQAWVPERHANATSEISDRPDAQRPSIDSSTPAAVAAIRDSEAAVAAATTEEERIAVLSARNIYRIALVYTGGEAVIIKQALGDSPAQKLLELCRAREAKQEVQA